jgi:hypothetical protein
VLVALAGILLLLLGTFHLALGLAGLLTEERPLLRDGGHLVGLSTTAWSWVHLAVGVVVLAAGLLVFGGRRWARAVGVIVCVLSAASAISSFSDHPGWVFTVLGFDALIVLALAVHGAEIRAR